MKPGGQMTTLVVNFVSGGYFTKVRLRVNDVREQIKSAKAGNPEVSDE